MKRTLWVFSVVLAGALGGASVARANEEFDPAAPAPAVAKPTSIWNWFGIPQGTQKVRDARINRRGNNPQRERVDPLKRIADPENLQSDNPAIKVAAEAKAEADLAPQKIKAIKFLATVCCCCSQYRAEVKKALLAALEDCTEEVRYEAAVALCQCSGNPCTHCNRCSCCDPDIMAKLAELAEGRDPQGCYLEASPRVRAAARNALNACEEVFRPTGPAPAVPSPFQPEGPIEQRKPAKPKTSAQDRAGGAVHARVTSMAQADSSEEAVATNTEPQAEGPRQAGWTEVGDDSQLFPRGGMFRIEGGDFELAGYQPPVLPPTQPALPELAPPPETLRMLERGPASLGGAETYSALEVLTAQQPIQAQGVTGAQARTVAASDLASLMQESNTTQSVDVQRRSPVASDPHVRGYKYSQIYTQANGVYWTPARLDLDSMLSKVDPGMIRDVVIIPGPYGVRYGPGFAFLNVEREPTPRHECFQSDFDSAFYVRGNGGQIYGRETVTGGGPNYGYRFSYGGRKGSDYLAGNSLKIPSSYTNQDIWGEVSYDLNPHQKIEFAYQRLDQVDTEYPAQFFDVGFLGTYGMEARIVDTDPSAPWHKLTVEGWYNHTSFRGDTSRKRLAQFPVLQRVDYALWREFHPVDPWPADAAILSGQTDGNALSAGFRAEATLGDPEESHWNVGADFRYLGQRIHEAFHVSEAILPEFAAQYGSPDFFTNMPRSWLSDPGFYLEWSNPITEQWTAIVGFRLDFVTTRARYWDLRDDGELQNLIDSPADLNQSDVLYAFYYTNRWKLNEDWTLAAGFGHAQRPPSLIERYADGLFLALAQRGFTHMIGNPHLNPERDWQIDVGLEAKREKWRGRITFFHAWILDYITYADELVTEPLEFQDARLLGFVNTPLATLVGTEMDLEYYLLPRLTPFARLAYVDGRDRGIDAPLPAISPLDSSLGLRLHDSERGRTWGIELIARVVDDQSRVAWIRTSGGSELTQLEEITPGFTVWNLRGYWNLTEKLNLIGGIDNLFDKTYQEHLDLRALGPATFPANPTRVLAPGFTAYAGVNWLF